MAKEILEILAPVGGLRRDAGYQQKSPYSFEDGLNVRAFDTLEGRGRIGSRPGLIKAFQTELVGTDVISDGGFTGSPSGAWTTGAGWTVGAGVATAAGAISTDLSQTVNPLTPSATYRVTFTVVRTAGSITPVVGGQPGTARSTSATFTEDIIGKASAIFKFSTSGFTGTVDNVSVKQIGPVNLASVVRTFNDEGRTSYFDDFPGSAMSTDWTHFAWTLNNVASTALPSVSSGKATAPTPSVVRSAALAVQPISTTAYREVTLTFTDAQAESSFILMDMNNTTPATSGAVRVDAIASGGAISLILYVNDAQKAAQGGLPTGFVGSLSFRMSIDSSNVVRAYWAGASAPSIEYALSSYTPAGSRVGFGLQASVSQPGHAESFSLSYISTSGGTPPEAAVFAAGHALYRESTSGALAIVGGSSMDLASDVRLHAASRLEKLYIADYGTRRERLTKHANATVTNVSGTQALLDDSDVTSWNALGIDLDGDVLEILDVTTTTAPTTPDTAIGIYNMVSIHDTNGITFERSNAWLAINPGGAVAYRIVRYPKIYDAATNTLTRFPVGTLGTSQAPAGCRSVVLWSDRLVFCNDPLTPHAWFMSRASYPLVFDYGDSGTVAADGTTTGTILAEAGIVAAVNGTQSEFSGLIGEPLITTIPSTDDYLIFACANSYYVMRGNPRLGGTMDNISREIGIVDIAAWARTTTAQIMPLTPDGLYGLNTQGIASISREMLPRELIGLTSSLYEVSCINDVERRGIHVFATGKELATPSLHYWFDLRTGGFFPDAYLTAHSPTATVSYQPGGIGMPTALFGCRDAYVRKFSDGAINDDGTAFDNYVNYGPIRLGGNDYSDGLLHELADTLDTSSGNVTNELQVGYSAQAARNNTARYSMVATAGRNYTRYPRLRGGAMYLKTSGSVTGIVGALSASTDLYATTPVFSSAMLGGFVLFPSDGTLNEILVIHDEFHATINEVAGAHIGEEFSVSGYKWAREMLTITRERLGRLNVI